MVAGHELSAGRGEALVLLLLLMVVGMVLTLKSGGWSWTLGRQRWGLSAVAAVNGGGHGGDLEEWWLIMDSLQAEVGAGGGCGDDLKGWWLDEENKNLTSSKQLC